MRFSFDVHSLTLCCLLPLLLSGPAVRAAAPSLQDVGTLECDARLGDMELRPQTFFLSCGFRKPGASEATQIYSGRLIDSDLWFEKPGEVTLRFEVKAPRAELNERALVGEYDAAPRFAYELGNEGDSFLFGGRGDAYALKLVSPQVDSVRASVRMQLEVGPSGDVRF